MRYRDALQKIHEKFHIHTRGDNLPYSSWLRGASRITLAELFAELDYSEGAEVGVRMGHYSHELLSKNPKLHLRCIDPWTPYGKVSQERQNQYYHRCENLLSPFNVEIIRKTSMEALSLIPDASLDFVYIDGRHEFDFVMQDIIEWSKKVRSGGIVSGHDYYNFYQGGVIPAVNAYTQAHNIQNWYITSEEYPSWFWLKG